MKFGRVILGVSVIFLASCGTMQPASRYSGELTCTDRDCLNTLVDNYLQALVAHDPGRLPFADNAVFVENVERKEIGTGLWETASAVPGDFRIYVPDPISKQVGFLGLMEVDGQPVLLGLRLQIDDGKIIAAEHLVADITNADYLANLQTPRAGLVSEIPEGRRLSRDELLKIGYSYYPALDDNDGTLAPFADDCTRFENGMQTSNRTTPRPTQAPELQIFGMMKCGPQLSTNYFQYIDKINNRRVTIADPVTGLVLGLSQFRHSFEQKQTPIYGVEGITTRDVSMYNPFDMPAMHIFKVGPEGEIHEIEAIGIVVPYMSQTGWGW